MRSVAIAAVFMCIVGLSSAAIQHMFLSRNGYVYWAARNTTASTFWSTPVTLTTATYNYPRRMSVCKASSTQYYLVVPYYNNVNPGGVMKFPITWNGGSKPTLGSGISITTSGGWDQPYASMCPNNVIYITDQGKNSVFKVSSGSTTASAYVSISGQTNLAIGVASDQGKLFWTSNVAAGSGGGIYSVSTSVSSVSSSDTTRVQSGSYYLYIDTEHSSSGNPWVWFTDVNRQLFKKQSGSSSGPYAITGQLTTGGWTCVATDSVEDQVFVAVENTARVLKVSSSASGIVTPSTVLSSQSNVIAISVYNSDAALPMGASLAVLVATIMASLRLMF